jgi:hypothetical protein
VAGGGVIGPGGVADAGAYLARLVRLDASALVRLRPVGGGAAGGGAVALWARLPFDALVTRRVPACLEVDVTVRAADLLAALGTDVLPARHDAQWRWPLPASTGRVVERLPASDVRRVCAAAADTLRAAVTGGVGGRAVGERILRDALLAHVPIVVTADDGTRAEVPQRLVQAVARMGFLSPEAAEAGGPGDPGDSVEVRVAGGWVGLIAPYGAAWHRAGGGLAVRPTG